MISGFCHSAKHTTVSQIGIQLQEFYQLLKCYTFVVTGISTKSFRITWSSKHRHTNQNHEISVEFLYWIYHPGLVTYCSYLQCLTLVSMNPQTVKPSAIEMSIICRSVKNAGSILFQLLFHIGWKPYSQSPNEQPLTYTALVHSWWDDVLSISDHHGFSRYAGSYQRLVSNQ